MNLSNIHKNIEEAALTSGRDKEAVTLIGVTKTKPIDDMLKAVQHGLIHVGENKVQEIRQKYDALPNTVKWHMIGHLQTNKVKYIMDKVTMIHSVDSIRLAEKINQEAEKIGRIMDILIQVNVVDEATKFGLSLQSVMQVLKVIGRFKFIQVKGLMTIAPYVINPEDNRAVFKKIKQLSVDIKSKNLNNISMDILSMGMTNDYKVAIEEGATMVRVGTGIFGKRMYKG